MAIVLRLELIFSRVLFRRVACLDVDLHLIEGDSGLQGPVSIRKVRWPSWEAHLGRLALLHQDVLDGKGNARELKYELERNRVRTERHERSKTPTMRVAQMS